MDVFAAALGQEAWFYDVDNGIALTDEGPIPAETGAVAKVLDLQWALGGPVGDSVEARWNVEALVIGDTTQLVWDVLGPQALAGQLATESLLHANDPAAVAARIGVEVLQSVDAVVTGVAGGTLGLVWNTEADGVFAARVAIEALVSDSSPAATAARVGIESLVSDPDPEAMVARLATESLQSVNALAPVGRSVQALWDIVSSPYKELALVWHVALEPVSDDLGLVWDAHTFVGDTVQAVWDVEFTTIVSMTAKTFTMAVDLTVVGALLVEAPPPSGSLVVDTSSVYRQRILTRRIKTYGN